MMHEMGPGPDQQAFTVENGDMPNRETFQNIIEKSTRSNEHYKELLNSVE